MCLGDLGEVVASRPGAAPGPDRVIVRTDRGLVAASRLLVPEVGPGDRVLVHSGHVLAVLDPTDAAVAADLRTAAHGPPVPAPAADPTRRSPEETT